VFIEAKDDGGGGDNWTTGAISRAKLQSYHHHQQTNIHFFQAGCPSCRPTNSVKALKGKILLIPVLLLQTVNMDTLIKPGFEYAKQVSGLGLFCHSEKNVQKSLDF